MSKPVKFGLVVGDPGDRSVGINPTHHEITVEINDMEHMESCDIQEMQEGLKKFFKRWLTDGGRGSYATTKSEYEKELENDV